MWRVLGAVTLMLVVAGGCGDREERTNVRPPSPGIPSEPEDVQGIYRTIHQGTLQLRGNGSFVMVISGQGASGGTYQLIDGRFTVRTDDCGEEVGDYRLRVTGEQEAGKARLEFATERDACAERAKYLTIDPWVYADS